MAMKTWMLWLLVSSVLSKGCCQHWSFGLSPGGKRELDDSPSTLGNQIRFLNSIAPCSDLSHLEESPLAKIYRIRGLLGSVTEAKTRYRTYKRCLV
uniref:Gonadoliberin n=1 Tax=Oryzias melastigma TaxID=30732 RepID=A0A3B3CBL9_ORYME